MTWCLSAGPAETPGHPTPPRLAPLVQPVYTVILNILGTVAWYMRSTPVGSCFPCYQITTPAQAGVVLEHNETCHAPGFTFHASRTTHHPPSTIHHPPSTIRPRRRFATKEAAVIRKQSPLFRKRSPLFRKRSPPIRKRKALIRKRNPLVFDDFAQSQRTCEDAGEKKFT